MFSLYDWLAYLEKLPTGLSSSKAVSLENTKKIAKYLDVINFSCPVITIAGTNGKGSCVAYLDTIWRTQGFIVGSYTSPHLLRYNERICINGDEATDEDIIKAFSVVDAACKEWNVTLNYFAFTTLAALLIFKLVKLDVIILEVGLGGRLDPVNVIDPDICVVTTISLDHVDLLGNNREKIGYEKAGIMRKDIPVICGDANPPESIFNCAKNTGALLFCLHQDFEFILKNDKWEWFVKNNDRTKDIINKKHTDLPVPKLHLQNAATSLMVLELMRKKLPITNDNLALGLKKTVLQGRFQWLKFSNNVKYIIDVAHNGESSLLLASNLKSCSCSGKTLAIVSVLKDKDIAEILRPLLDIVDEWYVCQLNTARGAHLEQLQKLFLSFGLNSVKYFISANAAINEAFKNCKSNDRIVSFGSFYMVAEVLKFRNMLYYK